MRVLAVLLLGLALGGVGGWFAAKYSEVGAGGAKSRRAAQEPTEETTALPKIPVLRAEPGAALSETAPRAAAGSTKADADAEPLDLKRDVLWIHPRHFGGPALTPRHVDAIRHHMKVAREERNESLFVSCLQALSGDPIPEARALLLEVAGDSSLQLPRKGPDALLGGLAQADRARVLPIAHARLKEARSARPTERAHLWAWCMLIAVHAHADEVSFLHGLTRDKEVAREAWVALSVVAREDAHALVHSALTNWESGVTMKVLRWFSMRNPDEALNWAETTLTNWDESNPGRVLPRYFLPSIASRLPETHTERLVRMLEGQSEGPFEWAAVAAAHELLTAKKVTRERVSVFVARPGEMLLRNVQALLDRSGNEEDLRKEIVRLMRVLESWPTLAKEDTLRLFDKVGLMLGEDLLAHEFKNSATEIREALAEPWR